MMRSKTSRSRSAFVVTLTLASGAVLAGAGCGSSKGPSSFNSDQSNDDSSNEGGFDDSVGGDDSSGDPDGGGGGFIVEDAGDDTDPGKCDTTISGKVYDPAGKNPLYNVVVYVPKKAVSAFRPGVSCDTCTSLYSGDPVAVAQTDASGAFKIHNVPAGSNVNLVIQVGKWRRQIKVPTVTNCKNTAIADKTLKLPKNHSEGDIPNIAISTGGLDTLECLLLRIGFDAAEFTGGAAGPGRIHIFQGSGLLGPAPNTNPPGPSSSATLWDSAAHIDAYDLVLLSCEGEETRNMNQQVLHDYASAGGRVFASHYHYAWFNTGPFSSENLAQWTPAPAPLADVIGDVQGDIVTKLPNGQPFPKGAQFKTWLGNVGALQNGQLPISYACHNADVTQANVPSTPWITTPNATEYLSFNTPVGKTSEAQCGRVVFSDLHVGAASHDLGGVVPTECATIDLTPQEKALEFMLFDLAACVVPDSEPPVPPPVVN